MLNNVLTSLSHIYLPCFVVWKLKKEIFYSLFHPSCFVLSSLKEVPHLFSWHQSLVKERDVCHIYLARFVSWWVKERDILHKLPELFALYFSVWSSIKFGATSAWAVTGEDKICIQVLLQQEGSYFTNVSHSKNANFYIFGLSIETCFFPRMVPAPHLKFDPEKILQNGKRN